MTKRIFDIVISIIVIVATLPLMAFVALTIWAARDGPLLFRQQRIGQNGKPFMILKFRTMRTASDGRSITIGHDNRITKIGAVLRQTKLDELPQLFNVLRGDMSIVGPRPEVTEYYALYDSTLRNQIATVRPGITDRASIIYRNEATMLAMHPDPETYYLEVILPHKQLLGAEYARNHSMLGDIKIILDTIRAIATLSWADFR